MKKLSNSDYDYFASMLKSGSGLLLGPKKEYLLESRLLPLCEEHGWEDLSALAVELRREGGSGRLFDKVNELMTTNESLFFRDYTPFEFLQKKVLKELRDARASTRSLSIWSAACSTGQEAVSIAISLLESPYSWKDWKIEILCSDLNEEVLERARSGVYAEHEISRGMPSHLLAKYFVQVEKGWEVKDEVKRLMKYKKLNLLQDFFVPMTDVIFLRNVLIYFEKEDKEIALSKVSRYCRDDGYLFLGAAESVFSLKSCWSQVEGVRTAVFRKVDKNA